jgi:hypothetical protein
MDKILGWGINVVANCLRLFIPCPSVGQTRSIRKTLQKHHAERLYSEQNGFCFWCRVSCTQVVRGDRNSAEKLTSFTVDHVIPASRGGRAEESIRGLTEPYIAQGKSVYADKIRLEYLPVVHEDEIVALMDALSIEPTRSRADKSLSSPSSG